MADKRDETTIAAPEQAPEQAPVDDARPLRMSREDLDQSIESLESRRAELQQEIAAHEAKLARLTTTPLERQDISRMDRATLEGALTYECKVCGARFEGQFGLDQHLRDFHPGVKNQAPKD